MRHALINDDKVVNIIEAEPEFAYTLVRYYDAVVQCPDGCGIDWNFIGGEFSAPPKEPEGNIYDNQT